MKVIMLDIIGHNQRAFMWDRVISNNTLIDYDIFYYMKRVSKGKKCFIGIKIDRTKTYDKVK